MERGPRRRAHGTKKPTLLTHASSEKLLQDKPPTERPVRFLYSTEAALAQARPPSARGRAGAIAPASLCPCGGRGPLGVGRGGTSGGPSLLWWVPRGKAPRHVVQSAELDRDTRQVRASLASGCNRNPNQGSFLQNPAATNCCFPRTLRRPLKHLRDGPPRGGRLAGKRPSEAQGRSPRRGSQAARSWKRRPDRLARGRPRRRGRRSLRLLGGLVMLTIGLSLFAVARAGGGHFAFWACAHRRGRPGNQGGRTSSSAQGKKGGSGSTRYTRPTSFLAPPRTIPPGCSTRNRRTGGPKTKVGPAERARRWSRKRARDEKVEFVPPPTKENGAAPSWPRSPRSVRISPSGAGQASKGSKDRKPRKRGGNGPGGRFQENKRK